MYGKALRASNLVVLQASILCSWELCFLKPDHLFETKPSKIVSAHLKNLPNLDFDL
jgi:hypothetical protein